MSDTSIRTIKNFLDPLHLHMYIIQIHSLSIIKNIEILRVIMLRNIIKYKIIWHYNYFSF